MIEFGECPFYGYSIYGFLTPETPGYSFLHLDLSRYFRFEPFLCGHLALTMVKPEEDDGNTLVILKINKESIFSKQIYNKKTVHF